MCIRDRVRARPVTQRSPSRLQRRALDSHARARLQRMEEEEELAAADASMLVDFTGVMKGGLFVRARSSFADVSVYSWVGVGVTVRVGV